MMMMMTILMPNIYESSKIKKGKKRWKRLCVYVFSIMGATLFVTHKFVLLFIQSLENKRINPKRIEKRGGVKTWVVPSPTGRLIM